MTARSLLVFAMLFATSVWVGGFVAIAIVTRVARRQLTPAHQVSFFRDLGRSFGAVIAAALTIATAAGVAQARRITRLRHRAVQHPDDDALADRVRRSAARALALRAAIGALTLALLLIAALLVSD